MGATRTYVKICGLTRPEDAEAAVAAGAGALGVILAESPRKVKARDAIKILSSAPEGVGKVAVLVDVSAEVADTAIGTLGLDWVQLSGSESPDVLRAIKGPVVKTIHVAGKSDVRRGLTRYNDAATAFLLDTRVPGKAGGTGEVFDWARVAPLLRDVRFMVGGGLTPDNVGDAIRALRPWAVDVSSGVESEPGIKDHALIEAFCEAVREADREVYGE